MGSWQLEVFRMVLYVSFPVLAFHVFNNPEWYEKSVIETKKTMYTKADLEEKILFRQELKKLKEKKDKAIQEQYLKYEAEISNVNS